NKILNVISSLIPKPYLAHIKKHKLGIILNARKIWGDPQGLIVTDENKYRIAINYWDNTTEIAQTISDAVKKHIKLINDAGTSKNN
ncbi:MAG: hypothetical protein WC651_04175, partial [Candidatus Gracilibacteria bacterium]